MSDDSNWDRYSQPPPPERARVPEFRPWDSREPVAPEKNWFQKLIAPILAFGAMILKFGAPVLKFLPLILKTGGSMLLMIGTYALFYGWKFALGFVVLLFIHEMGHSLVARWYRLPVTWPVFIPFLGAQIILKEMPKNAWVESMVGYGGPLLGTMGGLVSYLIGVQTHSPLFIALANSAFFLNLFNLVPIVPLDGGRVVTAISPWLWIVGLVILVPWLLWNMSGAGIFILFIVISSLPRVWGQFKRRNEPEMVRYYECTGVQRATVSVAYFGLVLFLAMAMSETHEALIVLAS